MKRRAKRVKQSKTITEMLTDIETSLDNIFMELPARAFAIYMEGWRDGQRMKGKKLPPDASKMDMYNKAIVRVAKKRGETVIGG